MAAALCIGQAAAAAAVAASAMPSVGYEHRPDASGGAASGKSGLGGGDKTPLNIASKGFFCPPCITRFPPNFVRQSSIKARRNCSNIGVAQVVAASATDRSNPAAVSAAGLSSSAHAEVVDELGNGSAAAPTGANEALLDSLIASDDTLSREKSSEAKKSSRSKPSTLAVHGGEEHFLLANLAAFYYFSF